MTEKERCITNLRALAKRKGIRIKDLETSCGVSVGYLSRLHLDQKQALPGSDFLFKAAAFLGTTVDSLVHFDYQLASDTDLKLHSFIKKLTLDSLSEKIIWDTDPECVPSAVILESKVVFPDHPLLGLDPKLLLQGHSKQYYASPFHPAAYSLILRDAWRASISEDTLVLLTRIVPEESEDSSSGESAEEIELYLYNADVKSLSPLCHTNPEHPDILHEDLSDLYETVSELLHRNALDQYAVRAIDAYLAGSDPGKR